jgi:DNA-binding XRE family transcriptional regulator
LESIKERVGAYIERTGTTKSELAQKLGMSRVTLHSKLTGQTEFRLSEAERLAQILGCSVDDLRVSPFS